MDLVDPQSRYSSAKETGKQSKGLWLEGNHNYELHFRFFNNLQYDCFATPQKMGTYEERCVKSEADLGWPPRPHWSWRNWNFVLGNLLELSWSSQSHWSVQIFLCIQLTFPRGSFWKSPCSGFPFDGKRCAFRKSATCPNFATQQQGWCWEIYWFKSRHSIAWAGTMLVWVAWSERLNIKPFQWARDQ